MKIKGVPFVIDTSNTTSPSVVDPLTKEKQRADYNTVLIGVLIERVEELVEQNKALVESFDELADAIKASTDGASDQKSASTTTRKRSTRKSTAKKDDDSDETD